MSFQLPFGVRVLNPAPVENKYFNLAGLPYTSTTQVFTQVPLGIRHNGLTVNINDEEYWFKTGTTNSSLILKTPDISASGGITGATNGLTKSGASVRLGGNLTDATTILNNGFTYTFGAPTGLGTRYRQTSSTTEIRHSNSGETEVSMLVIAPSLALLGRYVGSEYGRVLLSESNAQLISSRTGALFQIDVNQNNNEIVASSTFSAFSGIKYGANYSANFTPRSLVDVGYVTGLTTTSGVQTANNGLTKTGSNVRLGGTLIGNTTIDRNTFNLNITGTTGSVKIGGNSGDFIDVSSNGITLSSTSGNGIYFDDINGGGMYFQDRNNGGVYFQLGGGIGEESGGFFVYDGNKVINPSNLGNGIALRSYGVSVDLLAERTDSEIGNISVNATDGILIESTLFGKLDIGSAGNKFTDYRTGTTAVGIEYDDDYSLNYTNRSLVDKQYVDNIAAGLDAKQAVKVATVSAITGTYVPTGGVSGRFTGVTTTVVDGYLLQNGDRILVKNQLDARQNGVYERTSPTVWTRSTDMNGTPVSEVSTGNFVFVTTGDTQLASGWVVIGTGNTLTLNVDEIQWAQFSATISSYIGGNGIDITGAIIDVDLAPNSGLEFSVNQLRIGAGSGLTTNGGTLNVVALNGLTASANDIKLGGTLNGYTEILGDLNDLQLGSGFAGDRLGAFTVSTANNIQLRAADNSDILGFYMTNSGTKEISMISGDALDTNRAVFTLGHNITNPYIIFSGTSTFKGVEYAGNYSANYDARSLVDKEYVDNLVASSGVTANNGLTKTGGNIELGGQLEFGFTGINLNGQSFQIFNSDNNTSAFYVYLSDNFGQSSTLFNEFSGLHGYRSAIQAADSDGPIGISAASDYDGLGQPALYVFGGALFKGIEYDDDYSSNFIDRSLVDKEYVDNLVASSGVTANNGLRKVGNDIRLGGGLIGDTLISGVTHNLTFDNNSWTFGTRLGSFGNRSFSVGINNIIHAISLTTNACSILGGEENIIVDSNFSSIGGGNMNQILTSNNSFINSGSINFISDSNYSFIGCSYGAQILSSPFSFIGVGESAHYIAQSPYSFIGGGTENRITGTTIGGFDASTICGGKQNQISGHTSFIGGGNLNSIIGNNSSIIFGNTSSVNGFNSHIVGINNIINANTSSIFGGHDNQIDGGQNIHILGGDTNIAEGTNTIILGGFNNQSLAHESSVLVSSFSTVDNVSVSSHIIASNSATINDSNNSLILGGTNGIIESSNAAIISSLNSRIGTSKIGSVIIGGSNIFLTGSTPYVDTVAMPNVALFTTPLVNNSSDLLVWNQSNKMIERTSRNEIRSKLSILVVTANTTLNSSNHVILVDTTASRTITLPSSPVDGQVYHIKDKTGNALTNNITISGNGSNIDGSASASINTDYGSLYIVYSSTEDAWFSLAFVS